MAATAAVRVAHVSYAPHASHLKLRLHLHNEQRTFFRPADEKLDRVRYRLQLLASNGSTVPKNWKKKKQQQKKKHKKGATGGMAPTVPVKFVDAEGNEISSRGATVADALMRTKRLDIGTETFVVLHNQPIVTGLKVLEPIMAGITVIALVETEFISVDECLWQWFRLNEKNGDDGENEERSKKVLVSTERRYTPMKDDVGYRFYVECRAPTADLSSEFARDRKAGRVTAPVLPGPNRDAFKDRIQMGLVAATEKYSDAVDAFRVMSYNVLYDGYATSKNAQTNMFPYVKARIMKESRRMQLVLQEIEENNSDIVCLQEMGEHVYTRLFEPMLSLIGYHGFYSDKTGTTNEGCATFVRTTRFEVVKEDTVDLTAAVKASTNPALQNLLQDFPEIAAGIKRIPSIAQLLVIRSKVDPARSIILSNTHLFYRGDAHLIRLMQGAAIVECVSEQKVVLGYEDAAVVMCGDWNAHPKAPLVAFLLDGEIDSTNSHWQEAPSFRWKTSQDDDTGANSRVKNVSEVRPNRLVHDLCLVSACGIPAFTNFVKSFVDTLDYIMVGSKALQVRDAFPFFTEEEVGHEVALPSSTFPSDHVSLVCDLSWQG
uniref:Endonuclease/exonuclease/phosphatase domain-containing protein n=1 Tax=Peronospora matthiolae TaxID=2874970 RepID=A0AAV1UD23_9STRA